MHLEHGQGVALLQTKLNHSLPEHHSSSGFDLNLLQMLEKHIFIQVTVKVLFKILCNFTRLQQVLSMQT